MTLDRSWLRRGLWSAPWFGRSVPPLWQESEVTFLRADITEDGHGGFTSYGAFTPYLTMGAHVEVLTLTREQASREGSGSRKVLRIYMPLPEDMALLPKKNDRVRYTSTAGHLLELPVKSVALPLEILDHVEIDAEMTE